MSALGRQVQRWREVAILAGDDIQSLALRETGDVANWIEIADINGLRHPYIVASRQGLPPDARVLAYGDRLRVPGSQDASPSAVLDTDALGRDVALLHGRFTVTTGDLAYVAGAHNLAQAIRHRLLTEPGEIQRHPHYGCELRALLGERNTGVTALLAHAFVVEALRQEPRVDRVERAAVQAQGDSLRIDAVVHAIHTAIPVAANVVVRST